MEFNEMALNRQSTRNFTNKDVEIEKLIKICDISRLAPSACNSQPWKLHIIKNDVEKVNKLRKACQIVGLNKFLNDVNNFIVIEQVFGNKAAKIGSTFAKNDLNSIDIGILTSYICFSAMQENLGTCILGAFRKDKILQALNFKKKQIVRIVIAIGYPQDNILIRKKIRKNLDDILTIS